MSCTHGELVEPWATSFFSILLNMRWAFRYRGQMVALGRCPRQLQARSRRRVGLRFEEEPQSAE
jgi:hypothetical protein